MNVTSLSTIIKRLLLSRKTEFSTARYWDTRYRNGGNSGTGSYGDMGNYKAQFLNNFVAIHNIQSVIEFGCGDGNQLSLSRYPKYLGLDVSATAIRLCTERFAADPSKTFFNYDPLRFDGQDTRFRSELALSLDVIYHLVEDTSFELYMRNLFSSASRYAIIYSSDNDRPLARPAAHVRPRKFTDWIRDHAPQWTLCERLANPFPLSADETTGTFSEFHVFAVSPGVRPTTA